MTAAPCRSGSNRKARVLVVHGVVVAPGQERAHAQHDGTIAAVISVHVTSTVPVPCSTRISWRSRTPSAVANSQVGHGSLVKLTMRDAPSGCRTSGAYRWVVSAQEPSDVSTHASNPLTSTILPVGGVVAVSSSA